MTPEEEAAADERVRQGREWGAWGADMTAEGYEISERALARMEEEEVRSAIRVLLKAGLLRVSSGWLIPSNDLYREWPP